jgi:hypothetical protein
MAIAIPSARGRTVPYGSVVMAFAAAVAFIVIVTDYFVPHGTIAHSWGALLVVVSTGLMLFAALFIGLTALPRWLAVLFEILLILDVLGTGLCAYFLEADIVLALMVVALLGWIVQIGHRPRAEGP